MASPEENLAASLERAAKARSDGNEQRALTWDAAADRYRAIIDAKAKIATASKNIQAIKERISQPTVSYSTPTPTPTLTPTPTPTTRYDDSSTPMYSSFVDTPVVVVPQPTPPTPTIAPVVSSTPPPPPAKTASIDTVLFDDDSVPIEVMTDLIFENIGGQELINIARNDIVNGQKISYSPIKNLTSIQQQYNPNNIISLQSTSDKYFANFPIKLDQKIPEVGNGPNGSNVYIEESTGDLIIETINIESDEQVDIQIAISGTIYEADI